MSITSGSTRPVCGRGLDETITTIAICLLVGIALRSETEHLRSDGAMVRGATVQSDGPRVRSDGPRVQVVTTHHRTVALSYRTVAPSPPRSIGPRGCSECGSTLFAASWRRTTTSLTPAAAATPAKRRIGFRIHHEPIEEEIDRLRHHFDRVECGIVERVIGTLNEGQCGRHAEGVELRVKVDARLRWNRAVIGAVNKDRGRETLGDVQTWVMPPRCSQVSPVPARRAPSRSVHLPTDKRRYTR